MPASPFVGHGRFIIRDIVQADWDRFVARAAAEGWSRGALIKQLIRDYGAERISPSRAPDPIERAKTGGRQ